MPIIKSAKKRVRVAKKAAVRNSKTKRLLKGALKLFAKKAAPQALTGAQSALDKAAKKGVIHKNKAARLKKKLAAASKAAGAKPVTTKKTAAKPAPKKTAAKKASPAKKTTTAKKPAAKK